MSPSRMLTCVNRQLRLITLLLLLTVLAGATGTAAESTIKVAVGIPPLAYFVERIGGDRVEVQVLLAPGHSPTSYEPTPKEMAELSGAKSYLRVGVPFEQQLAEAVAATLPQLAIVDLQQGVKLRPGVGHHHHSEPDPHFWLDIRQMIEVSTLICAELVRIDSPHQSDYQANLLALQADLKQLDSLIAIQLRPFAGREIWVFHPAYGYFTSAYGLEEVSIEFEGKQPGARQLAGLVDRATATGVRVIFHQPQFSESSARVVAEAIGAELVELDPLGRDYLNNLRLMADRIEAALSDPAEAGEADD